jgi:hypothetical protein
MAELARNSSYFPNGAVVETVTNGTPGSVGVPSPDAVTTITVTSGPGGVMPPGFPAAWPGATVVMLP